MSFFENYTLSKIVSSESQLTNVTSDKFLQFSGGFTDASESTNPSASGTTEAVSGLLDIGFDFTFDGTTYKRIVACVAGWCALVDPTETNPQNVRNALMTSGSYSNEGINLTNTTKNVLLCPWFDRLQNRFDLSTVTQSQLTNIDPNADVTKARSGFKITSFAVSSVNFGVKYYRDKTHLGRRLIIRWIAISAITSPLALLAFECILYENGKIEFRYSPCKIVNQLTGTASESATIGIFASGSNRFRDFSLGLGYLEQNRQPYKYGGTTFNSNFQDSGSTFFTTSSIKSRNYVWRLRPDQNWPGQDKLHSTFVFAPPTTRKKILPRQELKIIDQQPLTVPGLFDDQKSLVQGIQTVINYPTTLRRFADNTSVMRQNLFSSEGNEIEITGSISLNAADKFFYDIDLFDVKKPFDDVKVLNRSNPFFSSSTTFDFNESLNQTLFSKKTIELNFPITKKATLPATTGTIYYLNVKNSSWEVPINSITTSDSDIATAASYVGSSRSPEDMRGFTSYGLPVSSGSTNLVSGSSNGSYQDINRSLTLSGDVRIKRALFDDSNVFSKSVSLNDGYKAVDDETFAVKFDESFLIEKVTFQVPVEIGSTWFNDLTKAQLVYQTSGSLGSLLQRVDYGGPGITVALHNQVPTNGTSRRELIASATFTHVNDYVANVVQTSFASVDFSQLIAQGFLHYGTPAAVISPNVGSNFTGSVTLNTEPCVTTGITLGIILNMGDSVPSFNQTLATRLLNMQTLDNVDQADAVSAPTIKLLNTKPSSRTGDCSQNGRSVFGRNMLGLRNGIVGAWTGVNARNPFYLTGSALTSALAQINTSNKFAVCVMVPITTTFKSPYLLQKNDKLVLSVSKHRPVAFSFAGAETNITYSGSVSHDVTLITGTVKMTLFGSTLRSDEATIPRNDRMFTKTVADVIGDENIVDQYEVYSTSELVGTTSDDYITGSIRTLNRGRIFSKFNVRNKAKPDVFSELDINPSLSFKLRPWFEYSGVQNNIQCTDLSERFWDSLMPGISKCFAANNASIVIDTTSFGSLSNNVGKIYLGRSSGLSTASRIDPIWMSSYPFEPRYLQITREAELTKSIFTTLSVSGSVLTIIDPVALDGFYPMVAKTGDDFINFDFHTYADVNLNFPSVTGSMSIEELSMFMYGFGDLNTKKSNPAGVGAIGVNKAFNSRMTFTSNGVVDFSVGYAPIVRGWKYGVQSGLPSFNRAYFRRNSYGQFRDMLEQRVQTKFFIKSDKNNALIAGGARSLTSVTPSVVNVKFINSLGENTEPVKTFSQNLSLDCTSSYPYFDGDSRNRPDINLEQQNSSIVFID